MQFATNPFQFKAYNIKFQAKISNQTSKDFPNHTDPVAEYRYIFFFLLRAQ